MNIKDNSVGSKIFDVINVIVLVIIGLLCLLPLWYVLCVSLSAKDAVNAGLVSFWPVGFNVDSYKKIVGEGAFFRAFWNSICRVVLGTLVSLGCILMAAYPLSRTKAQFPKRNMFMWLLIFCMLFNGGTVPWYLTMRNYKLIDNIWGLVLAGGLPVYNVILAMNFFKNLPSELEEAALDLGASRFRVFWDVTFPAILPGILSGAMLSFAMSFDDVVISIFVTGPTVNTLPVKIYTKLKTGVTPEINALATMMLLVTILVLAGSTLVGKIKNSRFT